MNNNRIDFFTKEEEEKILNFFKEFSKSESNYMYISPRYDCQHLIGAQVLFKGSCMAFSFFDDSPGPERFNFSLYDITKYIKNNDFETFKRSFRGFYYTWLGIDTTFDLCRTRGLNCRRILCEETHIPLTIYVYNKEDWTIEIEFNFANEYHIEEEIDKDDKMVRFYIYTDSIEQITPICRKLLKRVIFNR